MQGIVSMYIRCFVLLCFIIQAKKYSANTRLLAPDIFLIGAGKCGSTSLHDMIMQHSEMCPSSQKEYHFFSGSDFSPAKRLWYTDQFNQTSCPNNYFIDGTPRYIRSTEAPKRIYQGYNTTELARKKFILVLREPVSREFSWYKHRVRSCLQAMRAGIKSSKPFKKNNALVYSHRSICVNPSCNVLGCYDLPVAMEKSPQQALFTFDQYALNNKQLYTDSAYITQINNWLKYIPRDQLFIVSFETLQRNTTSTMLRLALFLQLRTGWGTNLTLPHRNENHVQANISCQMYDKISEFYRPLNEKLYRAVNDRVNKPTSEPHFPVFSNTRHICT